MRHALAWVMLLAACGPSGVDRRCAADDECPVDATCSAGTCVAIGGEGEGSAGEGEGSAGEGEGSAGEGEGGGEGEGAGAHCTLDDGDVTASDVPVVPGLPLRFVEANSASGDLPVDVDGTDANGAVTWDFTTAEPGDGPFQVQADFLADQWYASSFADEAPLDHGVGAYVAPLAADTVAIFRRSDADLVILGVASVEQGRTLITYDPPILVLRFPLTDGASFTSTSTGSGTFEFNPFYVSTDVYDSAVDGTGDVVTNAGTFKALRLRVSQSVTVGFLVVTHIQYAWVAACLGVVAQVSSGDNEADPHYRQASQVRRLASP